MIEKNKVVTLHYSLTDNDGELIESSIGSEPMIYLHGAENIIIGLEKELVGKKIGDKFQANINAEEAYGDYHDYLCQEVELEAFGDIEDIAPGMRFTAETDQGPHPVQVVEVNEDSVIVDGNHPLAGMNLTFDIEVIDIRDATPEEVELGHVHLPESTCSNTNRKPSTPLH